MCKRFPSLKDGNINQVISIMCVKRWAKAERLKESFRNRIPEMILTKKMGLNEGSIEAICPSWIPTHCMHSILTHNSSSFQHD